MGSHSPTAAASLCRSVGESRVNRCANADSRARSGWGGPRNADSRAQSGRAGVSRRAQPASPPQPPPPCGARAARAAGRRCSAGRAPRPAGVEHPEPGARRAGQQRGPGAPRRGGCGPRAVRRPTAPATVSVLLAHQRPARPWCSGSAVSPSPLHPVLRRQLEHRTAHGQPPGRAGLVHRRADHARPPAAAAAEPRRRTAARGAPRARRASPCRRAGPRCTTPGRAQARGAEPGRAARRREQPAGAQRPAAAPRQPTSSAAAAAPGEGAEGVRIQEPTDIGEVGLATRSMFRNRRGRPRSCTRAATTT